MQIKTLKWGGRCQFREDPEPNSMGCVEQAKWLVDEQPRCDNHKMFANEVGRNSLIEGLRRRFSDVRSD